MIHYNLRCSQAHDFDGWFRDSAAFDKQAQLGLLECPVCGDAKVERALMAPAVPRKGRARSIEVLPPERPAPAPAAAVPAVTGPAQPAAETTPAVAGQRLPDQVRAALQRLRAEVEKNCDYVGDRFAEEARRMHRGESEHRGIYGETTPDQAEALADEGIDIARVPWVPRSDG